MSSSPPRTPSPTEPQAERKWRFELLPIDVEWSEAYRPGGFHPLHLGDTLRDGRYTIIRKLGHGGSATVWLAEDKRTSTCVAIKVLRARKIDTSVELSLHRKLLDGKSIPDVKANVVTLLDDFQEVGPNGKHQCLVFEPTGPPISALFEVEDIDVGGFTYDRAKSISKQLLTGLHILHTLRIAHGDTNFGSLLISLRSPDCIDAAKVAQGKTEHEDISPPLTRFDGKADRWAPSYLCQDKPLTELVDFSTPIHAKLSDLGSSFEFGNAPDELDTPQGLRAPEIVLRCREKLPVDYQIDIWSLGCLIFEFVTGTPLFVVSSLAWIAEEENDDGHLLQMNDVLGPLPPTIAAAWPRYSKYFNDKAELIRTDVGPAEVSSEEVCTGPTLEALLEECKPADMDDTESSAFVDLLRKILQYDPASRPSTAELLEHEWFRSRD